MARVRYEPIQVERVLGVDPIARGFGYVVVEEEPLRIVDWGVRACAAGRGVTCAEALGRMVRRYEPTALVTEDIRGTRQLRSEALAAFMEAAADVLSDEGIPVYTYSRPMVREVFAPTGAFTKDAIARALAVRFSELSPRVPRPRRIWESEDSRMSIFDALSFALAHLAQERGLNRPGD